MWGWLVYYLTSAATTLNDELRAFPCPSLLAGLESGRFTFDDLDAASDLVVGAVRLAMQGVLNGERSVGYRSELARMILTALGLDRRESARIAGLPLPAVELRGST